MAASWREEKLRWEARVKKNRCLEVSIRIRTGLEEKCKNKKINFEFDSQFLSVGIVEIFL
jgi:hypothetical protein